MFLRRVSVPRFTEHYQYFSPIDRSRHFFRSRRARRQLHRSPRFQNTYERRNGIRAIKARLQVDYLRLVLTGFFCFFRRVYISKSNTHYLLYFVRAAQLFCDPLVCRLNTYAIVSPFSLLSSVNSYNFYQDFFPIFVDTSVTSLFKCLSVSLP